MPIVAVSRLGAEMEDKLRTLLCPQLKCGKMLGGAEAGGVPFDSFGDAWIGAKKYLPERENLWIERMIKRYQKFLDTFWSGRTAFGWFRR